MKKNIPLRGSLNAYNWLEGIHYCPDETEIVQVLFKNTRSAFFRNPDRIPLKKGDWVAVESSPGHDIGQVMLTGPLVSLRLKKANLSADAELKRIFRIASDNDLERFSEARAREHDTMIRSRRIAAELGLNMKIGDVEYQGDGAKAIFYYIADERVDFRKLIRILADTFKIRVEMKQIGARQEAGRIGGIGPCGRPLCCSTWMQRFVSVGTGAARIQDLSMNPQKLAGQCAKLKCCLNFETDVYNEAAKEMPPKDAVLITQDAEYYQFKTDILAREIAYSTDKHLAVNLVTISARRAFEIIEMNKRGEKPEQLNAEEKAQEPKKEYVEIVGQDSLTRFDKSKSQKRREKERNRRNRKTAEASATTVQQSAAAPKGSQQKERQPLRQEPQKKKGSDRRDDNSRPSNQHGNRNQQGQQPQQAANRQRPQHDGRRHQQRSGKSQRSGNAPAPADKTDMPS